MAAMYIRLYFFLICLRPAISEQCNSNPDGSETCADDDQTTLLQHRAKIASESEDLTLLWKGGSREPARPAPPMRKSSVVINEVMPHPATGREWVEVHNHGASAVDVAGWKLADKAGYAGKWTSTALPPGSYVLVEFYRKLNNKGDTVELFDSGGSLIDQFTYTSSARGESWMRIPDACDWSKVPQQAPTKGSANPTPVVINEVMPRPNSGLEWVEMYNPSACAVDVDGWRVKDNRGYLAWNRKTGSTLAAGSHVVWYISNKLNNGGDSVIVFDKGGRQIDSFHYTSSVLGQSWVRIPDGGAWSSVPQAPTAGLPNPSTPPTSAPAPVSDLGCGGSCAGVCFGTWNIQNLGVSKGRRPAVMSAIRAVLARYDVTAVQELSQKPRAPYVCGEYTESVVCAARPDSSKFSVFASPRIGDEQYVVLTRKSKAKALGAGSTYPDVAKIHSRPPHAFELEIDKGGAPWYLVLAGTHTSPHKATAEIKNFPDVLEWMTKTFPKKARTHYVLAGDFNADGSYFKDERGFVNSKLGPAWDGYALVTPNEMDTTVAKNDHTYDRIIADSQLTAGKPAVFTLESLDLRPVRAEGCQKGYVPKWVCDAQYDGLSWEEMPYKVKNALALELSDHHPVEVCLRG